MMRLGLYVLLIYLSYYAIFLKGPLNQNTDELYNYIKIVHKKVHPGENFSFYKLGLGTAPMYPYGVYDNIYWDYHFDHMWPIKGLYQKERYSDSKKEAEAISRDKEFVIETVADDLQRNLPAVVAFDRYYANINFFMSSPNFQKVMMNYKFYGHFKKSNYDNNPNQETDIYVRKF